MYIIPIFGGDVEMMVDVPTSRLQVVYVYNTNIRWGCGNDGRRTYFRLGNKTSLSLLPSSPIELMLPMCWNLIYRPPSVWLLHLNISCWHFIEWDYSLFHENISFSPFNPSLIIKWMIPVVCESRIHDRINHTLLQLNWRALLLSGWKQGVRVSEVYTTKHVMGQV